MIVRLYRYKRNFKTDSSDGWTRFTGRSFIKTNSRLLPSSKGSTSLPISLKEKEKASDAIDKKRSQRERCIRYTFPSSS